MFLPHYDVYRVSITEQTTAKCYLLVLYNKKVNFFAKISFCSTTKRLLHAFDVIMIYSKQSTPLAVDISEMVVIGLSLKWRQLCVVPLIDHGSRPVKS